MIRKIVLITCCAFIFGCGSSDDKNGVTANTTATGDAGMSSWGVPVSSTSSWGVPSSGTSSWGVPSSGSGGSAGNSGNGTNDGPSGAGGYVCSTEATDLPNCPTVTICSNGTNTTYATVRGVFTSPTAAIAACQ